MGLASCGGFDACTNRRGSLTSSHLFIENTSVCYFPFVAGYSRRGRCRPINLNAAHYGCRHSKLISRNTVMPYSYAFDKAAAVPQDFTQSTFAPLITREFTQIDWHTWDAHRLDRVHRAAHHHASQPRPLLDYLIDQSLPFYDSSVPL